MCTFFASIWAKLPVNKLEDKCGILTPKNHANTYLAASPFPRNAAIQRQTDVETC